MTRVAQVLRHVHFEDLGSFGEVLKSEGFNIRYGDVGSADFCASDPCLADLLVVLGGPIGVYDDIYPFLDAERRFIQTRLAASLPTLGICLGAQLIAAALGERVFPAGSKEIGFSVLQLTPAGLDGPLRHLQHLNVLHWHGDTYGLPTGGSNLASTEITEQQAFTLGNNVLGIQFHPEVETGPAFERWLVGHAFELVEAAIDVQSLRRDAQVYGPRLREAAQSMLRDWLAALETSS